MFTRRPRLAPADRDSLNAAHREQFGTDAAKPLAVAAATTGWCALLPNCLAHQKASGWQFVPWHTIEQGTWNDQNRELRWEELGGRRGNILMDDPGRVPEVFKERVQASIVVHKNIPIDGTPEGGVVSARRNLGDRDAPLEWRIRRGRGTPDSPEIQAILGAALVDLRTDFDI